MENAQLILARRTNRREIPDFRMDKGPVFRGVCSVSAEFTVISSEFTVISSGLTVISSGLTVISSEFTVISSGSNFDIKS